MIAMGFRGLGIEIRRRGDLSAFYKDVDSVLENCGTPKDGLSHDHQIDAVTTALTEMLKRKRHFSWCIIDTCSKVACIAISSERREYYRAFHCVEWADMEESVAKRLVATIFDEFRSILNPEPEFSDSVELSK